MVRPVFLAALCLLFACDGEDKPPKTKETPAKKADAKKPTKEAKADPKAAEKHLDISHDKSGALARAAAVLEAEGIDNEDLRVLSHHAEKLPSAKSVCEHMAKIHKSDGDLKDCIKGMEHHIVRLGPELYGEAADCLLAAKTVAELDACVAAEEEAEEELHKNPHGDKLDKDTCTKFFEKFEKLTMADAGEHAEHVKEVLEEVRDDVITGCMDHGAKGEMDCAEKAKTLHELEECAKHII